MFLESAERRGRHPISAAEIEAALKDIWNLSGAGKSPTEGWIRVEGTDGWGGLFRPVDGAGGWYFGTWARDGDATDKVGRRYLFVKGPGKMVLYTVDEVEQILKEQTDAGPTEP